MSRSKKYDMVPREIAIEHQDKIPEGAIGALMGAYYKIGTHGFAFYWDDFKWRRSVHDAVVVQAALSEAKAAYRLHNEGL